MAERFLSDKVTLHCGDCLEIMASLDADSVDAVVCDPPYHLTSIIQKHGKPAGNFGNGYGSGYDAEAPGVGGAMARLSRGFMGKAWDGGDVAFKVETWAAVLRVLKPGGHLIAFGGSRTYHRLACAIEDAGFEIRDQIQWLYGCLDDQTELVTPTGVKPHHETVVGDPVLCYDIAKGEYSYQPILEIVEYAYDDTAFHLIGDFGEQVVTRNHRCIVERSGGEVFQFAEEAARQRQARVPILEDMPELQQALSDLYEGTSYPRQSVRARLHGEANKCSEQRPVAYGPAFQNVAGKMQGLRDGVLAQYQMAGTNDRSGLLEQVQRRNPRSEMEATREQGTRELDAGIRGCAESSYDRAIQPRMEGWPDLSKTQGQVCRSADQVRQMPGCVSLDGAQRRLCDGASLDRGPSHWPSVNATGDGASQKSQGDGQQADEFDVVRDQRRTQGIRAWRGHRSAVVRILPFHYTGKVWCLRVPTGAFVAVRGGIAFPTGNSGFPKSHDVSKGIDRMAGAERPVIATGKPVKRMIPGADQNKEGWEKTNGRVYVPGERPPVTEDAQVWEGWGSALKPAAEPIVLARKPLSEGTVAANVLKWGTGALNIAACRVQPDASHDNRDDNTSNFAMKPGKRRTTARPQGKDIRGGNWGGGGEDKRSDLITGGSPLGRWPANVIHDGSEEVVAGFPESKDGVAVGGKGNATSIYGTELQKCAAEDQGYGGGGSAARFFYTAKADNDDRLGSKHPTVKPVDLMRYLVRLVTPPNGICLDPFAGTGTTGEAAWREGFRCILIEREAEYQADIRRRMALCLAGPDERARESAKARMKGKPEDHGPLFG